jgi:tetratricopeptide (TPR) repeat protein
MLAALNYLADHDLDSARRLLLETIEMTGPAEARVRLDALMVLGDLAAEFDEAQELYARTAALAAELQDQAAAGRALGAIGRLYARQQRYPDAIEYLHQAVARLAGDLSLHVELAATLLAAGQVNAASAMLGGVLAIDPGYAPALALRERLATDPELASS